MVVASCNKIIFSFFRSHITVNVATLIICSEGGLLINYSSFLIFINLFMLYFFFTFLLEKNMKNVKKFLNFSWFFFKILISNNSLPLKESLLLLKKVLCLMKWWSLMIFLLVKKDTISESRNLSNAVNANSLLEIFLSGLFSWNILYLNRRSEIWNWRPHRKWGIFELIDTGMIRFFWSLINFS